MANQFTNPFTNPKGFFSSQPGGFLAPPKREGFEGFLSDPRLSIGMAIAQGQPIGQALLGGAIQSKQIEEAMFPEAEERKIVTGADGFNYYEDGTRVLPNVVQEAKAPKEYNSVKAKDGYLRYSEGPEKGKKVFPDIEDDVGMSFDDESKLRKDFQDESKAFKEVNAAYGRILSNDPTPAGDISLIFQYMKMLDPRSTVREGEFATVQNAGSIPEIVRAKFNSVKEGTKLTEDMRADYLKQAENLYNTALENQSYIENEYTTFAEQYGFDPKRIVIEYGKPLEKQRYTKQISVMTTEELSQLNAANLTPIQLDILNKELDRRGKLNNGNS
jgi:hypothetical protein|tara:strand:- start:89 stop:1078 length:990 start_codon:yes stop_codon:yes gene_type:complete